MDVGIRELKKRLSELLDRVARGEVIRITDRGQPKAILMPIPGRSELERGREAGWITLADDRASPCKVRRHAISRQAPARSIADALRDDRGS